MQQPALRSGISVGSGGTLLEKMRDPGKRALFVENFRVQLECRIERGTSQMELAAHTPLTPVVPPSALQQAHHTEDAAERRIAPRRRVLKNALMVFRNGYCTHPCVILNLSETGARLMPSDIMQCPREFVLKPSIGQERECEVVWRKGEFVGVRYV
jgi:hypothetical protein